MRSPGGGQRGTWEGRIEDWGPQSFGELRVEAGVPVHSQHLSFCQQHLPFRPALTERSLGRTRPRNLCHQTGDQTLFNAEVHTRNLGRGTQKNVGAL